MPCAAGSDGSQLAHSISLRTRLFVLKACSALAVAFKIYDLDQTGYIEPGEVKRLMAALLHDNPAIALSDAEISSIVDQVRPSKTAVMRVLCCC